MPMYVYKCSNCQNEVEEIQRFDDPAPDLCPHCNEKGTLSRVMGTSNFALKPGGVGWAKDGYSG
jgi:putative FmdB family regulatory protein